MKKKKNNNNNNWPDLLFCSLDLLTIYLLPCISCADVRKNAFCLKTVFLVNSTDPGRICDKIKSVLGTICNFIAYRTVF